MKNRIDRMSLAPFAQRSALFSISILLVDLLVYGAMVFGAIAAEAIWLKLLFSFGLAFEVPVAVVLLVMMGIVPLAKLTQIRGYVLIAVFVIAAIITPPDAVSQTIMAIPMYLLYEGGILFARLLARSRGATEPVEPAVQDQDGGGEA